jgi:hypothetical protein
VSRYAYIDKNFQLESLKLLSKINEIIDAYLKQGFRLTVRQLYYQLVARALIENTEKSYKKITSLVNDGRMAGMIDWDAIEDRTRDFISRSHWTSGKSILETAAKGFHMDMWENQDNRVFVFVEKEALVGVLERVCNEFDVPLLAARGYPSVSVLREFVVERVGIARALDQDIHILHLGDHDPSGIDMTRDIIDRLDTLTEGGQLEVHRLALNMDQVQKYSPPPNPAKITDSRFNEYKRKHGSSSWELDAMSPSFLHELVQRAINVHIDNRRWKTRIEEIETIREKLTKTAKNFKG